MIDTFPLPTDFRRVSTAGGADVFGGFLEAPGTFSETPAVARGIVVVGRVFGSDGDARHAHLQGKFADGVDYGRELDVGG